MTPKFAQQASTLLLVVGLFVFLSHEVSSENLTYFAWTGFDQTWLRREFGFLTGHRISKFASFISNDNMDTIYNTNANFAFSPGVDGDYSFPSLSYVPIRYSFTNSTKNLFSINTDSVTFSWSDNASIPDNQTFPIADTTLSQTVEISLAPSQSVATSILHGFNLTCHCNSTLYSCNSNGIWPYVFDIGLVAINDSDPSDMHTNPKATSYSSKTSAGNGTYAFLVRVRIARSTNPGSEGFFPKPFNYNMDFKLEVFYSVFAAQGGADIMNIAMPKESISDEDELWNFRGKQANFSVPGVGGSVFDKYVVGIRRFAFELLGFKNSEFDWPLGRYFEGLSYRIDYGASEYNAESGVLKGKANLNVWAALTVYPANLTYEMDVVMMQFNTSNKYVTLDVLDRNYNVSGEICVSGDPHSGDLFFDCQRKDLPEQTTDTVGIAY